MRCHGFSKAMAQCTHSNRVDHPEGNGQTRSSLCSTPSSPEALTLWALDHQSARNNPTSLSGRMVPMNCSLPVLSISVITPLHQLSTPRPSHGASNVLCSLCILGVQGGNLVFAIRSNCHHSQVPHFSERPGRLSRISESQ